MTPTGRSLNLLRSSGYLAVVVESWIPRLNRRRDLFGFADVLAVHPVRREIVLVQTTTAGNLASRLTTIRAVPELPAILAAGVKVSAHGWSKRGGQWRVRIVDIDEDLAAVLITTPARRRRRNEQRTLFGEPDTSKALARVMR